MKRSRKLTITTYKDPNDLERVSVKITKCALSFYLQHPFRQASFLGELLEVLRVGIVIDREIALHRPQLMMLETRPHPLRTIGAGYTAGGPGASSTERHVYVVRVQVCNMNPHRDCRFGKINNSSVKRVTRTVVCARL